MKKCMGLVLLSWVDFISVLGMVNRNWWKNKVLRLEVVRGRIKFCSVFIYLRLVMIL